MSKLSLRDGEYYISPVSKYWSIGHIYILDATQHHKCFCLLLSVTLYDSLTCRYAKSSSLVVSPSFPLTNLQLSCQSWGPEQCVCSHLKTCTLEAGVAGSAAKVKLSQQPYRAKAVNWAATVTTSICRQGPGHNRGFSDLLRMRTSQQSGGESLTHEAQSAQNCLVVLAN